KPKILLSPLTAATQFQMTQNTFRPIYKLCYRFYQTIAANTARQINTSWNTIYLMPFICGKFSRYHSTALSSRLNSQYTFRHSVDDSVARREVSSKRFCSRCKFCYQRPI